jgi:hypothetical protein
VRFGGRVRDPSTSSATSQRREQRVAQNARLAADLVRAGRNGRELLLVCECGDESCGTRVHLTRKQYERARSAPGLFILSRGHSVLGDVVRLVADDFWIVEADGRDREDS